MQRLETWASEPISDGSASVVFPHPFTLTLTPPTQIISFTRSGRVGPHSQVLLVSSIWFAQPDNISALKFSAFPSES